jgi:glycosyltransferase involved in cell wall biosynthesis
MQKNKHLFISKSAFPSETGGPANTVHQLSKALDSADVFATNYGLSDNIINQYDITLNAKNDINGVNTFFYKFGLSHYFSISGYVWIFKNIIKYDVVHLTSFFSPISVLSALFCIVRKVKFTVSPRGELYKPALSTKSFNKLLLFRIYKFIYKFSFFMWVTVDSEYGIVRDIFPNNNIKKLPNSYDYSDFIFENKKSKKNKITFLGRLNPIKNIELIIKSYANLDIEIRNKYRLVIAGSGDKDYAKKLLALAKNLGVFDFVDFVGHTVGEDKKKLLSESICGVLVSKSENFGNVVLEFLASGALMITSNTVPWSALNQNNCGYEVCLKQEHLTDIYEHISKLSDEEYKLKSESGNKYVTETFDVFEISKQLNNCIQ